MSNKFYAVKVGRKKGVFNSWEECKKSVDGFPNAVYKSFITFKEANDFINDSPNSFNTNITQSEMIAYIDGSYDDKIKRYSYGVIIFLNGEKYTYSNSYSDDELVDLRNVAGELKAAIFVMDYAIQNNVSSVDIYFDYNGIEMWATGKWKAKLPFTQEYAEYSKKVMRKVKINYCKVKSHSGNKYNEEVDKLARAAIFHSNDVKNEVIDTLKPENISDIFDKIKGSKSDLSLGNILRNNILVTSDDVLKVFKSKWKKDKRLLKDISNLKAYYDKDNDKFVINVIFNGGVKTIIIIGDEFDGK